MSRPTPADEALSMVLTHRLRRSVSPNRVMKVRQDGLVLTSRPGRGKGKGRGHATYLPGSEEQAAQAVDLVGQYGPEVAAGILALRRYPVSLAALRRLGRAVADAIESNLRSVRVRDGQAVLDGPEGWVVRHLARLVGGREKLAELLLFARDMGSHRMVTHNAPSWLARLGGQEPWPPFEPDPLGARLKSAADGGAYDPDVAFKLWWRGDFDSLRRPSGGPPDHLVEWLRAANRALRGLRESVDSASLEDWEVASVALVLDATWGPALREGAEESGHDKFFGNLFENMDEASCATILPLYLSALFEYHQPWAARWFGLAVLDALSGWKEERLPELVQDSGRPSLLDELAGPEIRSSGRVTVVPMLE